MLNAPVIAGFEMSERTVGRALLDEDIPEKQLQQDVMDLARRLGWSAYHPWDSRRSACGFPDVTLARASNVGGRVIFAELKTEKGKLTPDQERWLAVLAATGCVETYLWRPSDWSSGEIERVLR